VRRAATLAALAALMVAAPGASANPITFPADPGFSAGSAWTASAQCQLLCTATGTQPASGGNPGGEALASYTTVANVLGLTSGSVDFTSSAFTWTGSSPASATLHLDTKASVGTLLALGGSAGATVGLTDVTAAHTTNLKSLSFGGGQAWTGTDVPVPSSLLTAGHSYKLAIHTSFSAVVAVLGGATVAYDNVTLAATRAVPVVSGPVVGTPTTTTVRIGAGADTAGADATYHVEYGATTSYGSATADSALAGTAGIVPIGVTLTGLTPLTTYHARLVVTSDGGTGYGPDVSFTTAAIGSPVLPLVPEVGAVTADVADARAADVSAVVQTNGLIGSDYRFEYGTTTAYGSATATAAVPTGDAGGWSLVEQLLTGLTPGTTYHVRAAVRLGVIWFNGADVTFTTPAAQAPAIGAPVVTAGTTGAQVGAAITPNTAATQWHVEYGLTAAYGQQSPARTLPAGHHPTQGVYDIAGLRADTAYHFRFVAISQDGTTYGADQAFRTTAGDDGGPTQAEGQDGGTTPATTAATPAAEVPATPAAPTATKAAVPPACRSVRVLTRSRGISLRMERFVTAGAPLTITPQRKAKAIKKVTLDGKAVAAKVKGRKVSLGAAQLKVGRHVLRVGTGVRAARLKLAIASCRSSLSVRTAGGRSRVVLAAVPGTTSVVLTLPKAYAKAIGAATLSIRANGKSKAIAIRNRTAFTAAAGLKVARRGASVTISGLPLNVTDVRLVLATKRLAARGVSATVATAKATSRLRARAITTK
jgi:hypothetical protein